jgi:hypothetical protein
MDKIAPRIPQTEATTNVCMLYIHVFMYGLHNSYYVEHKTLYMIIYMKKISLYSFMYSNYLQ